MKILIVSGSFYPQNNPRSFRTTELAIELQRQGNNVSVYVPQNNYNYNKFTKKYKLNINFINIIQNSGFKLKGNKVTILAKRMINRFLSTFLAYPAIQYLWKLPNLFLNIEGYDLLISIAAPHPIHWGVEKSLKKNSKLAKSWIADCGDPFMFCQTDTFRNPFYFKYFEKSFCRRANYITIPIESARKGYYPEFWNKIRIIPQGFDFMNIQKNEEFVPNEIVTFTYAGSFIPGFGDPRSILDFLVEQKIDFRFHVYTNYPNLIEAYKQVLGCKLLISDYIERGELIKKMSSCDFLLNIENGTSVQMPSKLIDYALSGRPILSIFSQNIDKGKFIQFLNRDYSQQYIVNNIEDYNIKNVAKKFVNLITK